VIASVRFAATDTIFIAQGASVQLSPQAFDASGQPVATTFHFTVESGGTSVTVDGQGMITATGPGISRVDAAAGSATATRVVAVFGHPSAFNQRGVSLGSRPYGIAVGPDGAVFVTQLDAHSVTRMSLPDLSIKKTIAVGATPTGIASTPASGDLVVTNQFDASVGIIDASSNSQIQTVAAPATTFRVILNRQGTRAYATASNGQLLVVDLTTRSALGTIGIPAAANGLAWGPDSTKLYVSSMGGVVSVIDAASGQTLGTVQTNGVMQDLAVAPDGSELYVADESGHSVDIFSLPQLAPTQTIALANGAFGLALTPDGSRLYVTQPGGHRITVIDRATRQTVANIDLATTGSIPRRIAFDRFGATAVVSDEAGAVWALDAGSGTLPRIASAIRFSSSDTVFLHQGDTTSVHAQAYDAAGAPIDVPISFTAAPGSGAISVAAGGVVSAAGPGLGAVVATAGAATATLPVGVFGHPAGDSIAAIAIGARPYGLAMSVGGEAFVSQLDARTITDVALPTLTATRSIPVGGTPTGLSLNAAGTQLLVANQTDPSVGLVDLTTNTQIATWPATAGVFRTLFAPDNQTGYATVADGHLLAIDLVGRTARTMPAPRACNGLAWAPGGAALILSCSGSIAVIDVSNGVQQQQVSGSSGFQDVVVGTDTSTVFVADEANATVDVFAWPALTPGTPIHLGAGAFGMALSPDGKRLYVTEPSGGVITTIDPAARTIVRQIALAAGAHPRRVTFDRFGAAAVVSDESGQLFVIR
jgi:YVTN family beta-propeller protein